MTASCMSHFFNTAPIVKSYTPYTTKPNINKQASKNQPNQAKQASQPASKHQTKERKQTNKQRNNQNSQTKQAIRKQANKQTSKTAKETVEVGWWWTSTKRDYGEHM